MTDPVLEGSTWPVNSLGEIVTTEGGGSRTITGQLPASLIPVSPNDRANPDLPLLQIAVASGYTE